MKKQTTKSNEMGEDVSNIHINLRESSLQKKRKSKGFSIDRSRNGIS